MKICDKKFAKYPVGQPKCVQLLENVATETIIWLQASYLFKTEFWRGTLAPIQLPIGNVVKRLLAIHCRLGLIVGWYWKFLWAKKTAAELKYWRKEMWCQAMQPYYRSQATLTGSYLTHQRVERDTLILETSDKSPSLYRCVTYITSPSFISATLQTRHSDSWDDEVT